MNDRQTDQQTARPKVSRLAIVAMGLLVLVAAFVFLGPGLELLRALHDPLLVYLSWCIVAGVAALAAVLALVALGTSIRRDERRGAGLCIITVLIAGLYAPYQVGILIMAGPLPGLPYCQAQLGYVMYSIPYYVHETGRVPRSIDDFLVEVGTQTLAAGQLAPISVTCPYDWERRDHPEEGGSSYVLAPLDERFFDEYFEQDDGAAQGLMLCAYCTIEHSRWRPKRAYVTLGGQCGTMSLDELKAWESAQAEAIGWLADDFPLVELEQIAEGGEGRRARMAWAILKYRRKEPERGTQGQGGG